VRFVMPSFLRLWHEAHLIRVSSIPEAMERIALFGSDACLLSGSFPSIGFKIRKPAAHSGNNAFRSIAAK
jgi:hypothetical protein